MRIKILFLLPGFFIVKYYVKIVSGTFTYVYAGASLEELSC
jgi:hypothetical protein